MKIVVNGCNGKMGQIISELIQNEKDIKIVAGIDCIDFGNNHFPVYDNINKLDISCDVIIDFSTAIVLDDLLNYCTKNKIPVVICTTGFNDMQLLKIKEVSKEIPVLRSANMSLGINLLLKMVKEAARILCPSGYDIEIIEKHHNLKIDSPSGTAIALADSINEEFANKYSYVFDRSQNREKRSSAEIGISSIRGGTIVGEHDVIFAGTDEIITLSHGAYSKSVFGKGAIEAARFLVGKEPGLYSMEDVVCKFI